MGGFCCSGLGFFCSSGYAGKDGLVWWVQDGDAFGGADFGDVDGLADVEVGDVNEDVVGEMAWFAGDLEAAGDGFKDAAVVFDADGFTGFVDGDFNVEGFFGIDFVEVDVEDGVFVGVVLDVLKDGKFFFVADLEINEEHFASGAFEGLLKGGARDLDDGVGFFAIDDAGDVFIAADGFYGVASGAIARFGFEGDGGGHRS